MVVDGDIPVKEALVLASDMQYHGQLVRCEIVDAVDKRW